MGLGDFSWILRTRILAKKKLAKNLSKNFKKKFYAPPYQPPMMKLWVVIYYPRTTLTIPIINRNSHPCRRLETTQMHNPPIFRPFWPFWTIFCIPTFTETPLTDREIELMRANMVFIVGIWCVYDTNHPRSSHAWYFRKFEWKTLQKWPFLPFFAYLPTSTKFIRESYDYKM